MQSVIAENNRAALDQKEYEKRFAALTERYSTTKATYDKVAEQIETKKIQRELIKGFISNLENTGDIAEAFESGLWCGLVDHVTIKSKEKIIFTFMSGIEIQEK